MEPVHIHEILWISGNVVSLHQPALRYSGVSQSENVQDRVHPGTLAVIDKERIGSRPRELNWKDNVFSVVWPSHSPPIDNEAL